MTPRELRMLNVLRDCPIGYRLDNLMYILHHEERWMVTQGVALSIIGRLNATGYVEWDYVKTVEKKPTMVRLYRITGKGRSYVDQMAAS